MKFELELTEEELREVVEHHSWVPTKIQDQIRAQLPKKSWEEKYKFLVGYIAPYGSVVERGRLATCSEQLAPLSDKIYGFTKAQFVRAVRVTAKQVFRGSYVDYVVAAEEFLEKQEASE